MNCIIVRYSEIGLKSYRTRRGLEKALIGNIKQCLVANKIAFKKVWARNGRIIITNASNAEPLARVFGVASASPSKRVGIGIDEIKPAALEAYRTAAKGRKSFRISCRRVTKDTKLGSVRINELVGEHLIKEAGAPVNLSKPGIDIGIEILLKQAYVFSERFVGPSGLPLGSQGRVACIFDAEPATVASCYLMMKRGCNVVPISFWKKKKIEKVANHIDRNWAYGQGFKLESVSGVRGWSTIMKRVERIAREYNCAAIVIGNGISLDKIGKQNSSVGMLVIRPVLSYSKAEIKKMYDKVRVSACRSS
jgi:thiamine biosynthesis protein ThiI